MNTTDTKLAEMRKTIQIVEDMFADDSIKNGLQRLTEVQHTVSGLISSDLDESPTNEKVAQIAFALIGEIFEFTQELGWKYWKENKPLDEEQLDKIVGEFGDILAFLALMMILTQQRTGVSPEMMGQRYFETCVKNIKRFYGFSGEQGYKDLTS